MAVCPICGEGCNCQPDHRDAEIARLRAALAAGPARLREMATEARRDGDPVYASMLDACAVVEVAQEAAMKGGG